MGISEETLAVAKKYTNNSISGISGSLAGKNCTIQSITAITGGNRITFQWTADDSTTRTQTMDVMDGTDGKGISSVSVNSSNHLIITYTDGTSTDAGEVEITAAVDSVNGETGDVILTASDVDAYSKTEVDSALSNKADKATTLSGYGITDAYTKAETDTLLSAKADSSTTLSGYGITDAYTKTEADSAITTAIGALDVSDTVVSGSYVTGVSETDGAITVTREAADTTPTSGSTKMVTSGGVYTDTQNVYKANGVLGAKNLLPYPYYSLGDTYLTINDDGSLTYKGNNTSDSWFRFNDIVLPAGTYILSAKTENNKTLNITYGVGSIDGQGNYTSIISVYPPTADSGSFTLKETTHIRIRSYRGANVNFTNPVTVYVMLRLASDTDSTYQPYAETNYQLTQNKVDWKSNSILGAKNLLPYPYKETTKEFYGITFTDNGDGSITANGTATNETTFTVYQSAVNIPIVKGLSYTISGCPEGGTASTYRVQWSNSSWTNQWVDYGDGKTFTITDSTTQYLNYIRIDIQSGTVCDNLVFKPMIRLATDNDDTYQPYAMTNQELTSGLTNTMLKPVGTDGTTPLDLRIRTVDVSVTTDSNGFVILDITIPYLLQAIPSDGTHYASVRKSTGSNTAILYIHDESMTAYTNATFTIRLIYLASY